MYFVDSKLIEKRLTYFDKMVSEFSKTDVPRTFETEKAVERMCQMMIEVMMDVGNQMIDGFIMRDPGSYEDIVHILVDEKVVSKEDGKAFEALLLWRKELMQNYIDVNIVDLFDAFKNQSNTLDHFSRKIRLYLENELGPVSAFLPKNE
jgi:uncharacterized protein YutE (UPF0331/DUF86 family)